MIRISSSVVMVGNRHVSTSMSPAQSQSRVHIVLFRSSQRLDNLEQYPTLMVIVSHIQELIWR